MQQLSAGHLFQPIVVSFIDAAEPATYARFTKDVATPGDYTFTLTAKDGEYTESSDVIVALYYNGCDAAKGEEEDYQNQVRLPK